MFQGHGGFKSVFKEVPSCCREVSRVHQGDFYGCFKSFSQVIKKVSKALYSSFKGGFKLFQIFMRFFKIVPI